MNKSKKIRLSIAGCFLVVFGIIAYLVMTGATATFDHDVDYWVYSLRGPVANNIMIYGTHLGDTVSVVIVLALLILLPRTRLPYGVPTAITVAISAICFKFIKAAFGRPRPDEALRLIVETNFSFPSGHSMNNLVCYGMLIYLMYRYCENRCLAAWLSVLMIMFIVFIGFSRVYVGVHYVTDIMGGFALGTVFLMLASVIIESDKVNSMITIRR